MFAKFSERLRRHTALCAAGIVLVLASAVLVAFHHPTRLALGRRAAITVTLRDPALRSALVGSRWSEVTVNAIDSNLDRVSFFEHARVLAQVAVRRDGFVVSVSDFRHADAAYGAGIAYQPGVLLGLSALFVLSCGVVPWRRIRNLDVAAALSLLAPVILLQKRYLDASVVAAIPGLAYLMLRCLRRSLGFSPPRTDSRPLLNAMTRGPRQRICLLRILLGALAFVFVVVTLSSAGVVDVAYATMEGATKLIGGVLPYGHMPGDVIHGDTYPLLSYVLYAPLALLAPVRSTWSSVEAALAAAAGASLAIAVALFRATGPRDGHQSEDSEPQEAGLRAAIAWLAFPPALAIVSSGTTGVLAGAMLVLALLVWRRPAVCTAMLSAGAWFKLAPLALLPTRIAPLRGRRLAAALVAIAVVSVPMILLLLALGGPGGPEAMIRAVSFQFSRGSPQSVWSALGIEWLQPLAQGAVVALIAGSTVKLWLEPSLASEPARMAALAGAIMIALQLAADYWSFLYLVLVVPVCAMGLLAEPVAETTQVTGALSRTPSLLPIGTACPGSGTFSSRSPRRLLS